jgi:hypothetical protein
MIPITQRDCTQPSFVLSSSIHAHGMWRRMSRSKYACTTAVRCTFSCVAQVRVGYRLGLALRRLECAVRATEHREREDDLAVLGLLVVGAE